MTPSMFAGMVADAWPAFRLSHMQPGACTHGPVHRELDELAARGGPLFTMTDVGRSVEGRILRSIRFGTGPRRIMAWSQMHGDEPTATLALLDILNALVQWRGELWLDAVLREVTVVIVPLLNPDGAERRDRNNAAGINVNRDALACASPEAEALAELRARFRPEFAFNLHDQELSSVADRPVAASLSLLAPPPAADRRTTGTRLRAIRLAAHIARVLEPLAGGTITRYDDTFEPRAFGDTFQAAGTSTVLIESGHMAQDPEKGFPRKLNVVGILTALRSIANGSYEDTELDHYHRLPPNGKRMFDLLIRGVVLTHPSGWERTVDLGLQFQKDHETVLVKEIGDLHTHGGLDTVELARRPIPVDAVGINAMLRTADLFDALQVYRSYPAIAFRP